ncbi:Osmotin thaumatin-like protein [Dichomitus squalens]|uniref:Osmotin thaumatin-like protein n=1 Tax=Dichomitus squalens TaxID=114155 RepID=A0A4Q9MW81_9APHY|nr:Osmotin thaumatin-like protein [Dichomitus squalens]TBU48001.1 Osmotin thaumatin-like protein [Dichomitus squalens]TBU66069.1 Osmotin thaumatin-like protein [Dichomitus squalens]
MKSYALVALIGYVASASAFTITFQNRCSFTVWPAVGKAPNGQPDPSVAFGHRLDPGQSTSFGVDDSQLGIRAWGRTGCDASGANCATGKCNGGLVCTDAGITSGVILSEYGFADFGQFGGQRTSWDLSHVDASINIDTQLTVSDGQSVLCRASNCPDDQAFSSPTDFAADHNSPLGQTYTHIFCP